MKKGFFVLIVCAFAILIPIIFITNDSDEVNTGGPLVETDGEKQAVEDEEMEEGLPVQAEGNYRQLTGTVTAVSDAGTYKKFRIQTAEEEYDILFTPETVIINNEGSPIELAEGQTFTAFVNLNKPMMMIYPPSYSPEVIVVETSDKGLFKQGQFNEAYVSEALQFKLILDAQTEIVNVQGENVAAKDIVDKDVIVFYTRSTRSIPEQAPINKIIVLPDEQ